MRLTMTSLTEISKRVKDGKYRLRTVSGGKSDVWKSFGIVVDDRDTDLDYVACRHCHTVLSFTGRQSGTSSLKRHKCRIVSGQTTLTSKLTRQHEKPGYHPH